MSPSTAAWISLGSTIVIFLLGLALIPTLRNLVNGRIGEFEERFSKLEETAHQGIANALADLKDTFHEHNSDAFAHANLVVFAELKTKLEEVRKEIVELRVSLEARMAQAKQTATSRFRKRKA